MKIMKLAIAAAIAPITALMRSVCSGCASKRRWSRSQ